MSTVIQAACPGCKKPLRIPAEWLKQAIRCKHCGQVIQARKKQTPASSQAVEPAKTTQPAQPPAPAVAPQAVPQASPVVPAAAPITQGPQAAFGTLDQDEQNQNDVYRPNDIVARRRRSQGMGVVGYSILGGVLLVVGLGFYFLLWPAISDKINKGNGQQHAQGQAGQNPPNKDGNAQPTKDGGIVKVNRDENPKDDKTPPPVRNNGQYPRRAMVISIHNYLFANPTHFGTFANSGTRNIRSLLGRLNRRESFRIPPSQVTHLSDVAKKPHSPTKDVVMKTIQDFLGSSRAQDRIVLAFIGRCSEVEDEEGNTKAYLVPIEGELDVAETLIPMDWLYKELEKCKARQKVLLLDVCRFNPDRGQERPGGYPMTEDFDKVLQNPPKGVQVWSSCIAEQQSYEFDYDPVNNSVFIDALFRVANTGVQGKIQKHDDDFPLEEMVEMVNAEMKRELGDLGYTQTSRLSGKPLDQGAAYDPSVPNPPTPTIAKPDLMGGNQADESVVRAVLDEVNVPPIKPTEAEGLIKFEAMPPVPKVVMDKFPMDNMPSKLRDAVKHAQVLLWAISAVPAPKDIAAAVDEFREQEGLQNNLSTLKSGYRAPNEAGVDQFKARVIEDQARLTRIIRLLDEELEERLLIPEMEEEYEKASKRWQANFDFIVARVQAQYAFVYEYQSMLGSMRKELPQRDPMIHNGWKLASRTRPKGDREGRKAHREAKKRWERLKEEEDFDKTPWEILAKRESLTSIGLEWQPTK